MFDYRYQEQKQLLYGQNKGQNCNSSTGILWFSWSIYVPFKNGLPHWIDP